MPRHQAERQNPPVEIPEDVEERVRTLCLGFPEVTVGIDESRSPTRSTAYSYCIRRRSFCLLITVESVTLLVLRVDPDERRALLAMGDPYFPSRAGTDRVEVHLDDDTDWTEIRELVTDSYRILAPKKLHAQLE